jgi:hypothetical protein
MFQRNILLLSLRLKSKLSKQKPELAACWLIYFLVTTKNTSILTFTDFGHWGGGMFSKMLCEKEFFTVAALLFQDVDSVFHTEPP